MSIHHFSNEQFPEIFLACKIFKVITKGFIGIHWTRLVEILKQSKVRSCLVLQDIIHFNKSLQYIRYAINVMAEFLVIHIATRICPLNDKLCSLQRIRYLAIKHQLEFVKSIKKRLVFYHIWNSIKREFLSALII